MYSFPHEFMEYKEQGAVSTGMKWEGLSSKAMAKNRDDFWSYRKVFRAK